MPPLSVPSNPLDYFPDAKSGGLDDFVRGWYGKHLTVMREPSLWLARSSPRESYRFTWLRTWGRPVAIRFDVDATGATMRYVELDGQGGYEPGKIAVDRTRRITPAEWTRADWWTPSSNTHARGLDAYVVLCKEALDLSGASGTFE